MARTDKLEISNLVIALTNVRRRLATVPVLPAPSPTDRSMAIARALAGPDRPAPLLTGRLGMEYVERIVNTYSRGAGTGWQQSPTAEGAYTQAEIGLNVYPKI